MNILKYTICAVLLAVVAVSAVAQKSRVELFMGAELHMRDVTWDHLFDVQVQLTPGMKWNMGRGWKTALQMKATIVNSGYASEEWVPQPGVIAVSKEWNFRQVDMKVSAGNFSNNRYGLDVKAKYYPCDWFALGGQLGVTGFMSTVYGWRAGSMQMVTGTLGTDFYIRRWKTQLNLRGGRFINEDWGGMMEVYEHFNHCSVGVYAQVSSYGHGEDGYKPVNGGFTVVMMIPPYKYKKYRKVRFRPASNFMLRYNMTGGAGCNEYNTDPEENPRNSWFDRTESQWEKKSADM